LLKNLINLFRRKEVKTQIPIRRFRKIYRLKYLDEEEETEEKTTKPVEKTSKKGGKRSSSKSKSESRKNEKRKSESVDDVEGAIELLIEAAKKLACPFCKARIVHEVQYLLTYDYKSKLIESGVDPKDVDTVFEERYAKIVNKRVEKIRKELGVHEFELRESAKAKAKELLG